MNDYRSISYSRYSEMTPDYARFANAYARRIGRNISIAKDWSCLDIACGYGNFLSYLRSIGVEKYTGVDSAKEAIKIAEAEFGQGHVECNDVIAYLHDAKNRYQFISAIDFVEHLKKDELYPFLSLINQKQEKGDHLLLRIPNANGMFGMASRYNDITHEITFTPGSIADVLERSGYRAMKIWDDGPASGSLIQTLQYCAWFMIKTAVRVINAVETGAWGDGVLARNMWVLAKKRNDFTCQR